MSPLEESAVSRYDRTKQRVQDILTGTAFDLVGRVVVISMISLILLNVLAVMAESVAWIRADFARSLEVFETFSVTVFLVEYILRLWSCTANPKFRGAMLGRIRFVLTPLAVVDLLAVLPALLLWTGMDLRFLRALRLTRLFRLAKLGRYSRALQAIWQVVRGKRTELVIALLWMAVVLVVASSLMYMAENEQQPEAFSSIPATMWWGIMTLTTVGYGDVYPITVLGKLTAAVIAVVGIGLFALPAGILGSAFVELREQQNSERFAVCPHCGKLIDELDKTED